MTENATTRSTLAQQNASDSIPHDEVTRRRFLEAAAVLTATSLVKPDEARAANSKKPYLLGYSDRLSYEPGDTIALHLSGNVDAFDLKIVRAGAKNDVVLTRTGIKVSEHKTPADASANGCRWPVAVEIKVPNDWSSGFYEVLTQPAMGDVDAAGNLIPRRIYFTIRSGQSGPHAKILLQLSTNTDAAYNNWGGYSLYAYNGRNGVQGRRVSFLRPTHGMAYSWEIPFILWAERNGYQLDYAVNNDLEFHPEILDRYKLVLSVGHDEYWSTPMRDALEGYVARGGNVAFFSGNVCCWQVRAENDGLVCYKEYFQDDPLYQPAGPNPTLTTLWSHHLLARPENQLTGVGVLHGGFHRSHNQYMDGSGAFTVHRPQHWVFEGTGLSAGGEFGGERTIVGYECDGCQFEMRDGLPTPTGRDGTPANFEILATAPAKWGPEETVTWYERWPENQHGAACLGLYTKRGGGTVFTAGTTDWAHGLSGEPLPIVDRITRNVLDRLSS